MAPFRVEMQPFCEWCGIIRSSPYLRKLQPSIVRLSIPLLCEGPIARPPVLNGATPQNGGTVAHISKFCGRAVMGSMTSVVS